MPKICRGCGHMKPRGFYVECELKNKNLEMKIPGDYTSFECSDRLIATTKEIEK